MTKTILVVDDNPDMMELLTLRLEANDYKVLSAMDGLQAIELVKKECPDLIILDVMLPKMSGYETCRILKFDNHYERIPIILLTAKAQQSDKDMSVKVKADAFMNKPFDGEELMRRIEELLAGKE